MVMKEDIMFLTLVILEHKHLGQYIGIFLQSLMDALNILLEDGLDAYDNSIKKNFKMKVVLFWTINAFLAFELSSGWGTKGRLACPHYMGDTKMFYLKHGYKVC